MHFPIKITPFGAAAASRGTLKQRFSIGCYVTATAVAMVAWLYAFGWLAAAVATRLIA